MDGRSPGHGHGGALRRGAFACAAVALSLLLTDGCLGWDAEGVGPAPGGVGILVTNIDPDPRPDIVLVGYEPSSGTGTFRYRVGWNLGPDGKAATWSATAPFSVAGSGPNRIAGAAAIADIDTTSRPELVLMDYVAAGGRNTFSYRLGRNLTPAGAATAWDGWLPSVEEAGPPGVGAALVVTNLDANPRPEMIIVLYDAVGQKVRYKIGWNLRHDGSATRWNNSVSVDAHGLGGGRGLGAAIINLDDDPRPELIVATYDRRDGKFHFNVCWNLDAAGCDQRPGSPRGNPLSNVPGFGAEQAPAAGVAVVNLDDNPRPELLIMAYGAAEGAPAFHYRPIRDIGRAQRIQLVLNKVSALKEWPPTTAMHSGAAHGLESIFGRLGVEFRIAKAQDDVRDLGSCYSKPNLDHILSQRLPPAPSDPGTWPMSALFVTSYCDKSRGEALGMMFDHGQRRSVALFMKAFDTVHPDEAQRQRRVVRTLAHELGHAFCLYHEDADNLGTTIMTQEADLDPSAWGYAWNAPEFHRIYAYGRRFWSPGSGLGYFDCKP
jgi:hypothetical protein